MPLKETFRLWAGKTKTGKLRKERENLSPTLPPPPPPPFLFLLSFFPPTACSQQGYGSEISNFNDIFKTGDFYPVWTLGERKPNRLIRILLAPD